MSKKICLLTDSLGSGGAERVVANMSISLSKKGYEVSIVSMNNDIAYRYEGQLYNFGEVKAKHNSLMALFKFKNYFSKNHFEVIIDHRVRNKFLKELLFSKFIFNKKKVIYCVHSYDLTYYFSFLKFSWLAKLPHASHANFVSVSSAIQKQLKAMFNINSEVVYNYIIKEGYHSSFGHNYIIGVGRLTESKQFNSLIKSYCQSKLPNNGINLIILGDGSEKQSLLNLVSNLKLIDKVKLMPFNRDPYNLMCNAKALILSSKIEGFPMVLVESLSLGTPVISFNCKSGPSEIIENEVNGLLVEDQNEYKLTLALDRLLDDAFYQKIKKNTHVGLDKFSEEVVIQKWLNILENHR